MAIVGLGTDIAEIERVQAALARIGDKFAKRILTDSEWQVFATHKNPERYLAKRFAAKEAASKALGTGIAQGVSFHDFVIANNDKGKPTLTLCGQAEQLALSMAVTSIHLSISDEKSYAVATVIFESNG